MADLGFPKGAPASEGVGQPIFCQKYSVADPGFPRGWCANSRGAPTYNFAKISQKLHEIERILTTGDVPRAPLSSATDIAESGIKMKAFKPIPLRLLSFS